MIGSTGVPDADARELLCQVRRGQIVEQRPVSKVANDEWPAAHSAFPVRSGLHDSLANAPLAARWRGPLFGPEDEACGQGRSCWRALRRSQCHADQFQRFANLCHQRILGVVWVGGRSSRR